MSAAGPGTKYDSAGEGHQQFTLPDPTHFSHEDGDSIPLEMAVARQTELLAFVLNLVSSLGSVQFRNVDSTAHIRTS
jgi:hypothetical protein